jgi:NAD(P)-dependent dehydrogenase (short-subunit alcohol dehydrogenase family)
MGCVTPLTLDVTSTAWIQAAAGRVGSLDVLINNAGVALYDAMSDRAALERSLAVNLFGAYGVTQAFLPLVIRPRRAIVNISAGVRLRPVAAHPRLLDLEGGRVLADAIAARPFGRARRTCRRLGAVE